MTGEKHTIDATNQSIGRLASQVAMILLGKHKPTFKPNVVSPDMCEVINVKDMQITGKKLEQKKYYRVSQYPGGIKETSLKDLMNEQPEEVLRKAVLNMLPKNKLRKQRMKRLIIS